MTTKKSILSLEVFETDNEANLKIRLRLTNHMNFTLWSSSSLPDDFESYKKFLDEGINYLNVISKHTEIPTTVDDSVYMYIEYYENEISQYVSQLREEA